jgi:tRNA (mo5U34)-methyltransferase
MRTPHHDALEAALSTTVWATLQARKLHALEGLNSHEFKPLLENLRSTSHFKATSFCFSRPKIEIGRPADLSSFQHQILEGALRDLMPWKKGPFDFFGHSIDSEWRSDWKWERLEKILPKMQDKVIADIGCNNGYYMLRMATHHPRLVIGLEPFLKHYITFKMIQNFTDLPNLRFEPLGLEDIDLFPKFFDVVFCLGILYHQTDPISALCKIHHSLKRGGSVIIDCQGIPGNDSVALTPAKKYAGAKGVWFLPTLPCLENWIKRARFQSVECFYAERLLPEEQRTTPWAPVKSLQDFLTPDLKNTVEGYPAPMRFYVRAKK